MWSQIVTTCSSLENMIENNKYRIKEYCGEFSIQIYAYEENGFLWWKKKEWSWMITNAWGRVWGSWPICQPFSRTFKSLEKAQQQIKIWSSVSIYHVD